MILGMPFKAFVHTLRSALEAGAVFLTHSFFRALPPEQASRAGGALIRTLGPLYARGTSIARRNLYRVFPDHSPQAVQDLIVRMWDNLGRVVAEYAHLDAFHGERFVQVVGREHVDAIARSGQTALFFAGHIANWEAAATSILRAGCPLAQVYRAANNPWVDRMIRKAQKASTPHLIPRGPGAGRDVLRAMQKGIPVMMMVDTKMDNGISVSFLGEEAMTAPALARLALKFRCPLVPVRVERLEGMQFRVTFLPPLDTAAIITGASDPVLALMTHVNALLGDWIRARPEQWLWVHRRWPSSRAQGS